MNLMNSQRSIKTQKERYGVIHFPASRKMKCKWPWKKLLENYLNSATGRSEIDETIGRSVWWLSWNDRDRETSYQFQITRITSILLSESIESESLPIVSLQNCQSFWTDNCQAEYNRMVHIIYEYVKKDGTIIFCDSCKTCAHIQNAFLIPYHG